jgi:hypothetical protein
MADPDGSVRRVYELAGQPLTPEGLAAMEEFGGRHPRGRHGSVAYDLGDFGPDPEERRRALRSYSEHFGVPDGAPRPRLTPGGPPRCGGAAGWWRAGAT